MSRIPALIFVVLASATVACGSSDPASGTSGSHLFGDDQCKLDPNHCTPPSQPPASGGKCFDADLSSSACLDANTWSSIAAAACGAQGAKVTQTTFGAACGATTNGQPGGQNGSDPSASRSKWRPLRGARISAPTPRACATKRISSSKAWRATRPVASSWSAARPTSRRPPRPRMRARPSRSAMASRASRSKTFRTARPSLARSRGSP